jgi:hypothetical protein
MNDFKKTKKKKKKKSFFSAYPLSFFESSFNQIKTRKKK